MQTPPILDTAADVAGPAASQARLAGPAMMAGAVVFAAAGYFAGEPSGTAAYTVSNVAGLIAVAFVLVGFGVFNRRYRAALGRLGGWGIGLVRFGLLATVLGYLVNLVGPLLPGQAAAAVAVVGIPAWSLAHLMYVGATVLGIACLRSGAVPRLVAVPLVCGLPLLLAGVGLGLAVGGTAATVITWIATEGQAGLAWFLVGLHLRGRTAS
ncbi:hypothetical protein OCAE111667_11525 [Occultella aeris]|uniref:Uncharacterized protein n=1 Tax=Occultella aeris TaxID=2761496 RepID=A0A7M4DPR0_9MICO|nr:hypothetical protein [Occultella aeris]VZO39454.1 hypothetical protein HALOF300_04142 [Occultella aeris]